MPATRACLPLVSSDTRSINSRSFADFSAAEKDQIAENLGEILGLNGQEVSEIVNAVLDENAQQMIEGLDDFDFDL